MHSFLYFQYPPSAPGSEGASADESAASQWGTPHLFPQARLRLSASGDAPILAMLFSDDPKEAIDKNWTGDRYYFQVPLEQVTDPARLDGAEWWHAGSSSPAERDETSNGVFLKGDRYHLEPLNVIIHFDGSPRKGAGVQIRISGQFLQYDSADPAAPPKPVMVRGVLMPRVEVKD